MLLFMLFLVGTAGCGSTRSGSETDDPSNNSDSEPRGTQDPGDEDTEKEQSQPSSEEEDGGEVDVTSPDSPNSETIKEQHQRLFAQSSSPVSVSSGTCSERGGISHRLQFRTFSKTPGGLVCDLLINRVDGAASSVYFAVNNPDYCETQGLQRFINAGAGKGRTCQKFVGPQRPPEGSAAPSAPETSPPPAEATPSPSGS